MSRRKWGRGAGWADVASVQPCALLEAPHAHACEEGVDDGKTKAAKSSTCLTCRVGHVSCEFLCRFSLLPRRSSFLGRPPRGFGGPLKSDGGTVRTHFLRKLVDKSRSSAIAVDRGSHFEF